MKKKSYEYSSIHLVGNNLKIYRIRRSGMVTALVPMLLGLPVWGFAQSTVGTFSSVVTIQGPVNQTATGSNVQQNLNVGSAEKSKTNSFSSVVTTGAITQTGQNGAQQFINVGGMNNSQANKFDANVTVGRIEQVGKSGERQELDIGSVTNSAVSGTATTRVEVTKGVKQTGNGEIVLGSVKNSNVGQFESNLSVRGKVDGNNIRMGSVVGGRQYNNTGDSSMEQLNPMSVVPAFMSFGQTDKSHESKKAGFHWGVFSEAVAAKTVAVSQAFLGATNPAEQLAFWSGAGGFLGGSLGYLASDQTEPFMWSELFDAGKSGYSEGENLAYVKKFQDNFERSILGSAYRRIDESQIFYDNYSDMRANCVLTSHLSGCDAAKQIEAAILMKDNNSQFNSDLISLPLSFATGGAVKNGSFGQIANLSRHGRKWFRSAEKIRQGTDDYLRSHDKVIKHAVSVSSTQYGGKITFDDIGITKVVGARLEKLAEIVIVKTIDSNTGKSVVSKLQPTFSVRIPKKGAIDLVLRDEALPKTGDILVKSGVDMDWYLMPDELRSKYLNQADFVRQHGDKFVPHFEPVSKSKLIERLASSGEGVSLDRKLEKPWGDLLAKRNEDFIEGNKLIKKFPDKYASKDGRIIDVASGKGFVPDIDGFHFSCQKVGGGICSESEFKAMTEHLLKVKLCHNCGSNMFQHPWETKIWEKIGYSAQKNASLRDAQVRKTLDDEADILEFSADGSKIVEYVLRMQ